MLGNVFVLAHLVEHGVTSVECVLGAATGVVQGGVLTHTHQHGSLFEFQLGRRSAEIYLCGRLNAHSVVEEVKLIEVHGEYLLFGVEALELGGNHPLYGFLQSAFEDIICTW